MLQNTLAVTLMAVSDWLLLSGRPAPCTGLVLSSCLSEVTSFWDLDSSRRQVQRATGGRTQLCQDRGALHGDPRNHSRRGGEGK